MAACAWNLKKWLAIATIFLFWQKLGLFFVKSLKNHSKQTKTTHFSNHLNQ
jgi:hypothetical protein